MSAAARPVYLDHNATTPLAPEVVDAMLPYLREHFGNPSSAHVYGRRARDAVETARARVAELLGAAPEEIVFTSGGTEANNLAILGVTRSDAPGRVVTSRVEHPATVEPCRLLERRGSDVTWLPVDETGRVREDDLAAALRERTALVSIMHANNETGTVQPIAKLAHASHDAGASFHTDAAQSAGKIPVRVDELGVDLLSIAGHKLHAPKGVGALYVRGGTRLLPLLRGAGHERGLRPGTENVAAIVGLGVACALAGASLAQDARRTRALRDLLWERLTGAIAGVVLNGHPDDRLPNTLNVRFPNVRGSELLALAPEVAASTGSACHEGGGHPSAVLAAMGIDAQAALGSVRLSLGRYTTREDIVTAGRALVRAYRHASGSETTS